MDYGFAPGGTGFDAAARRYLEWRPASSIVPTFDLTVQGFVERLTNSSAIQRPVNDLGIGCHGLRVGLLSIQLDHTSSKETWFEDVRQVEARGTVKLASSVLDPRPAVFGVPVIAQFRIVGCSIGAARPFLEHLKAALGGDVIIVATPHMDAIGLGNIGGIDGALRFLEYDFFVTTPLVLEGQEDVIEAFDQKHFTWLDGTPIPRDFWKQRVPVDVFPTGSQSSDTWIDLNPKVGTAGYLLQPANIWEHLWEPVGPFRVTPPATNLASTDQRREFMRAAAKNHPIFSAGHPWPLHQQRGYASFDAFIDGYDWLPLPGTNERWSGYRNVYRVHTPVVQTNGKYDVFYDFVSANTSANRLGLPETDARFFVRV